MNDVSSSVYERADRLYDQAMVIDGAQASEFTAQYMREVRDAGVSAVLVTVAWNHSAEEARARISDWRVRIDRNDDVAILAGSSELITRAKVEGKVAYCLAFQNADPLEGDERLVDAYRNLGVKIIQLTYNGSNALGFGCRCELDHGLTPFGRRVIARMNDLDMLVDLSHVGDRTAAEAIDLATRPVFSHANARSVCDNVRNKPDELLKAVADKDGIVGINAFPAFVRRTRTERGERPTLDDLLVHIDYVIELVGEDHVGIGLDLIENTGEEEFGLLSSDPEMWGLPDPGGVYRYPEGIETVHDLRNIARGMVASGYTDVRTRKVLGGNWLRVLRGTDGSVT